MTLYDYGHIDDVCMLLGSTPRLDRWCQRLQRSAGVALDGIVKLWRKGKRSKRGFNHL